MKEFFLYLDFLSFSKYVISCGVKILLQLYFLRICVLFALVCFILYFSFNVIDFVFICFTFFVFLLIAEDNFRLVIPLVKVLVVSPFGVKTLRMNSIPSLGTISLIWFQWQMQARIPMDLSFSLQLSLPIG